MRRKEVKIKSNAKAKIIILIALGILFALLPIITTNLSFITGNSNNSSEYSDDINFDSEHLKISAVSGKIHIINNSGWVAFKNDGNCTGNGTYSDPYIIEDLVINGGGSGSCILIENSSVYFRIENCTLYNSEWSHPNAGIRLLDVNNSLIITNICWPNYIGIYLGNSYNNTISGNTANDNTYGILLSLSDYNTISGNTVNNNGHGISLSSCNNTTISGNTANNNYVGIHLSSCNNNTISGNTANSNSFGMFLSLSDYNTISGNTLLGNDECIIKVNCGGNIFENNDCGEDGGGIPIELIVLISVGGGAVIGVATILLIRRKRKRIE